MTEKYPVIDTETGYWEALERLEAGSGPVAVDAERASGFKFSQRAYLIQLYREGSGTILFDPPAIGSLAEVTDVIGDEEWIFHAASQDLACLREVGMNPQRIFDTELAGRLLGMPRVALGTVVEELLGIHLKKEHSAADWSTRPLPESWLEYAALDVELLPQLREAMATLLDESGKASIAEQEFQAVLDKPANPPRVDPWRRLSGLSRLRTPRALAVARSLWLARDAYAREVDVSPGRLLPDSSIVAVSAAPPATISALAGTREFTGRASRTELSRWWAAIENGVKVAELPEMRPARERGVLPHPKNWADRNPGAADRLAAAKVVLAALSESLKIPQENIVSPETVRQLSWNVGDDADLERVVVLLRQHGARDWQIDAVAQPLLVAFVEVGQEATTELNPDS